MLFERGRLRIMFDFEVEKNDSTILPYIDKRFRRIHYFDDSVYVIQNKTIGPGFLSPRCFGNQIYFDELMTIFPSRHNGFGEIPDLCVVALYESRVWLAYSPDTGYHTVIHVGYGAEHVFDVLVSFLEAGSLEFLNAEVKNWRGKVYEFFDLATRFCLENLRFVKKDFLNGLLEFWNFVKVCE